MASRNADSTARPTRSALLVAATAVFALLVMQIAAAGSADRPGSPRATASTGLGNQVKKLKRQVKKLKQQVAEVAKQPGPPGPPGKQGEPGPSTGPAGGDLSGNYPNPSIAGGAVTNPKLAGGAVTGAKVASNTLGATQINESSLDYAGAGCKGGLVFGWARIKGFSTMPNTYSTSNAHRDIVHNCGGGTTEVRRLTQGNYMIRFNNTPSLLAVATVNDDETGCPVGPGTIAFATVRKVTSGGDAGAFQVRTFHVNGDAIDACVTVMTF